jgi:hypothetical protein
VTSVAAGVIAVAAFALLQFAKAPNWAVVIGCAVVGQVVL